MRSRNFSSPRQIERRLLFLAGAFLVVYALALTLSPSLLAGTWEAGFRWGHWLVILVWAGGMPFLYSQLWKSLPAHDPYLLPLAGLLSGWGALAIWRLEPGFGFRQTLWILLAFLLLMAMQRFLHWLEFLRRYKYLWLSGGLLLTGLTLVFGTNPLGYGPRLWLGCCGLYFQPSEPLKLLLIIYLASYLADRQAYLALVKLPVRKTPALMLPLLAPTLLMTGLALLVLVAQRDLGTGFIFLLLYALVVYVATGKRAILLYSLVFILAAGIAGTVLFSVVQERVMAWIFPHYDSADSGYQIIQAMKSIANGGILGRGPGLGNPEFIPVAHSDFIYAAISEELGLVGVFCLLSAIAWLVTRGIRIALSANSAYARYLAFGLIVFFGAQSILIIGGNIRLLPLTGVTLPFISYGGSSLVTCFFALSLLLQISNQGEGNAAYLPAVTPYWQVAHWLWGGLLAAALLTTWWAVIRADELLQMAGVISGIAGAAKSHLG